jgi:hypothetical protein
MSKYYLLTSNHCSNDTKVANNPHATNKIWYPLIKNLMQIIHLTLAIEKK